MSRLSKKELIVFIVATVAGALLHFVYQLLPNPVTALFSPVNESLWEHLKILFWPLLVSALYLTRGGEKGRRAPRFLSLLLAGAGMLAVGYLYHVSMAGDSLTFDICLYVLMMGLGFLLPNFLDRDAIRGKSEAITFLILVLGCIIVLFTFLPPDNILFADLSRTNTWNTIPYC